MQCNCVVVFVAALVLCVASASDAPVTATVTQVVSDPIAEAKLLSEGTDTPGLGPVPESGPGMTGMLQEHSPPDIVEVDVELQAQWNAAENALKRRRDSVNRVAELVKKIAAAKANITTLNEARNAANSRIQELVDIIGEEIVPTELPASEEPGDVYRDPGQFLSESNTMDATIIPDPPTPEAAAPSRPKAPSRKAEEIVRPSTLSEPGEKDKIFNGFEGSGNAVDLMEQMPVSDNAHNNISFASIIQASEQSSKILGSTKSVEQAFENTANNEDHSILQHKVAWAVMNQVDTTQLKSEHIPQAEEIIPEEILHPKHAERPNITATIPVNRPDTVTGCCVDKSTIPYTFNKNIPAGDCLSGVGLTTFHLPGTSCVTAEAMYYPETQPPMPPVNETMDPPGIQTVTQQMNGRMATEEIGVTTNNDLYTELSGFKPDNQMEDASASKLASFAMPEKPFLASYKVQQTQKTEQIAEAAAMIVAQPSLETGTKLRAAGAHLIHAISKSVTPEPGIFLGQGMPERA
eukprot:c10224_g1_i1.p1 GENE.c10224_g1_i1~~c10224_g1_i1.p1  ORF type:complete len:521 (-),score=136.61 c10224_g1_i1:1392-2954(-)